MTIWTALILGLLIGWIVEWVIDWIYWRQRTQSSTIELENLRSQNSRLRADLNIGTESVAKLKADVVAATSGTAAANAGSNTELAALRAEHERLQAELNAANGSLGQYKAELGTSNTNLSTAQSDRDRLRAELDALRAERAPNAQGAGNQYKTQLLSIDPTLAGTAGVHLSDTGDRQDGADFERLRTELADAHGEIERLRAQLEARERTVAVGERPRDPLIDINGIGPVYEQRLFDAGIYTFADLVAQSPARLRELVAAKSWQDTETEAWIAEAQQFIQAGRGRSAQ
ncbi:MAG: helix-hairpin-helix domain-containing protein [Roseiflexaceae bacterium]